MKANITILTALLVVTLLTGCTKSTDVPETKEERVVRLLTGLGNKYWHLKEVYVMNVKQTLTDYQSRYTKTYTSSPSNIDPNNTKTGTFTNSDNFSGTWRLLDNGDTIRETITNNQAAIVISYTINSITETTLDVEYVQNLKLQREVYYAY